MEQSKTESSTVLRAQREANVTTKNHEPRGEPEVEKEKEQNRSEKKDKEKEDADLDRSIDVYAEMAMNEEMIDADDLLDENFENKEFLVEEGREEEEQIEAVAQLSQNRSTRPPLGERMKEKSAPQVKETSKEAALDEQNDKNGKTSLTPLGKKRGAKSPDLKGDSASRKLANRGRLSPKKKQFKPSRDPIIPARRSEKFPRIEVYPSAIKSRKPMSTLVGRSGGLALFYMNDAEVQIEFSNERMIDIAAKIEGQKVFIIFVYGDPVVEYRELVWERLMRISLRRSGAWLMVGDFNEIISEILLWSWNWESLPLCPKHSTLRKKQSSWSDESRPDFHNRANDQRRGVGGIEHGLLDGPQILQMGNAVLLVPETGVEVLTARLPSSPDLFPWLKK
uniref:DUF4283 domain-containing protein n=1 Tax=Brassica oleracea var. oleracea TaxID=109376 RepID=A0A0D3BQJ0_BRAOL